MHRNEATGAHAQHRYNWCPGCGELWLAAWMARLSLGTCPSCDSAVLAYVGRSPYDPEAAEMTAGAAARS